MTDKLKAAAMVAFIAAVALGVMVTTRYAIPLAAHVHPVDKSPRRDDVRKTETSQRELQRIQSAPEKWSLSLVCQQLNTENDGEQNPNRQQNVCVLNPSPDGFFDNLKFTDFLIFAATILMARATFRQVGIARDAYLAVHRPEIIVRTVEAATDGNGSNRLLAWVSQTNCGVAEARVLSFEGVIVAVAIGGLRPGVSLNPIAVADRLIKSGGTIRGFIESPPGAAHSVAVEQTRATRDHEWFCLGLVRYSDSIGRAHETGFCRRLDIRTRRWNPEQNPDYEYRF